MITIAEDDPYKTLDPIFLPWAARRQVRILTKFRDDAVRTYWIFDSQGQKQTQVWLDLPDKFGNIEVHAAKLDPSIPRQWSRDLRITAKPGQLENVLEEVLEVGLAWTGPGSVPTGDRLS
jgi:hypothetical protein